MLHLISMLLLVARLVFGSHINSRIAKHLTFDPIQSCFGCQGKEGWLQFDDGGVSIAHIREQHTASYVHF